MRLHAIDAILRAFVMFFITSTFASGVCVDLLLYNSTISHTSMQASQILGLVAVLAHSSFPHVQVINMERSDVNESVILTVHISDDSAFVEDFLQRPKLTIHGQVLEVMNISRDFDRKHRECSTIALSNSDDEEMMWSQLRPTLTQYYGSPPSLVSFLNSTLTFCIRDENADQMIDSNRHTTMSLIDLEVFINSQLPQLQIESILPHKLTSSMDIPVELFRNQSEAAIDCPVDFCFVIDWDVPDELSITMLEEMTEETMLPHGILAIHPRDKWLVYDSKNGASAGFECILHHSTLGSVALAWVGTYHSKNLDSYTTPLVVPNGWEISTKTELEQSYTIVTLSLQQIPGIRLSQYWEEVQIWPNSNSNWPQLFDELHQLPSGSIADMTSLLTSKDNAATIEKSFKKIAQYLHNLPFALVTKRARHLIQLDRDGMVQLNCLDKTMSILLEASDVHLSLSDLKSHLLECLPLDLSVSVQRSYEGHSIEILYRSFDFGCMPTLVSSTLEIEFHPATFEVIVV